MTVTLSVGESQLTFAARTTGATIFSGNGIKSGVSNGTVTQINNLLAGNGGATVTYNDGTDTPAASTTITLQVSDIGNTSAAVWTASDTATINIAASNDAPVATITPTSYSA